MFKIFMTEDSRGCQFEVAAVYGKRAVRDDNGFFLREEPIREYSAFKMTTDTLAELKELVGKL